MLGKEIAMRHTDLKRPLFPFVLLLIFACEGEEGPVGEQGNPGVNSLVNIVDESPGSNCETGGVKIETGLDSNSNGVLDGGEINATRYVCNGIDGNNTLISTTIEEEGENCENGGLNIAYGLDINRDNILNDGEILYTTFVCNGVDGNLSLVNFNEEPNGENCENGGLRIDSGIDSNGNAILDTEEVNVTRYICQELNGVISEEIRIKLGGGVGTIANTTSSTPRIAGGVTFDIRNFRNVGSVYFESDPWVADSSNFALLELYNQSDDTVIPNTLIRVNNLFENRVTLNSQDILNEIPQKEINLGIRLSSEINGAFSSSGTAYLVLISAN